MANALTKFGQRCRDLRSRYNKSIGDQADAFACQPHEISAVETGKTLAPDLYAQKFVDWLGLNDQEKRDLLKRIDSNVISFPGPKGGGDKSTSMRLFRKISKMNPSEIRGIKKKPPP